MKYFLFLSLLLVGLAGCSKKEDVSPTSPTPTSQPATLIGMWAQVKQVSTDGQTTNTGTYKVGEYSVAFTSTEYVWYSGSQQMYRYPYTVTNSLVHVASTANGNSGNDLTIKSLTSTELVLTFSGGPGYSNLIFTNTYVRQLVFLAKTAASTFSETDASA